MKKIYRTKQETIEYFKMLSFEFSKRANMSNNSEEKAELSGKSEAYKLAAFELEKNMI